MNIIISFLNIGCQKNGDESHNIHKIARVANQSSDNTPEWEELYNELQHPRTDCGYFQLGNVICSKKKVEFLY